MKKGLKIFALGVAVLGLGCIGLAGCGTTDEFADADAITVAEFNAFQAQEGISNSLTNYTVKYTYSGVTVDAQCQIIDNGDETYSTNMAFTLDIPAELTGTEAMSAQCYLTNGYLYISSGDTKIYYDYSEYEDMDYTTVIEGYASIDDALSTVLDSSMLEYLTIKKISTSNQTKFQLNISDYTDPTEGVTGSVTIVVVYDQNNQFTSFKYDTTFSYEDDEGNTITESGSIEIAQATKDISFPDFTDYTLYTETEDVA